MSFELFVVILTKLLGPPIGRSYWHCPACDSSGPSLSVRPPKGDYPIKFRCHRCGWWGDVHDVLRELYPNKSFAWRQARISMWRSEFEREYQHSFATSVRGSGTTRGVAVCRDDPHDVGVVWAFLRATFHDQETGDAFALQVISQALEECEANDVSVRALVDYWRDFHAWIDESTARHAADCDDPLCGDSCRAARGLPSLTHQERELIERETGERERQKAEKIRRAVNGRRKRKRV